MVEGKGLYNSDRHKSKCNNIKKQPKGCFFIGILKKTIIRNNPNQRYNIYVYSKFM